RYPDLLTQRLIKAALAGHACPYAVPELERLAEHCTTQEDAANKVERQVRKSAAALVVASRVGEELDALVTGASSKGTFVRVISSPTALNLCSGPKASYSSRATAHMRGRLYASRVAGTNSRFLRPS